MYIYIYLVPTMYANNRQIDNFVNSLKLFARSYHPAPPTRLTRVTPLHI